MYLLDQTDAPATDRLRDRLVELGDSVLVVGDAGTWNVHAHVDDVGAAIEAGVEAGRPHAIRVTRLLEDQVHPMVGGPRMAPALHGPGIVACVAGEGLARVFHDSGAAVVVSKPGQRATTGQLIAAIRDRHAAGADGVIVLPNDGDTELAAAAAVRVVADDGISAHVVRSRAEVQGIAAMAVFEPSAPATDNVQVMQAAASGTRHGAVTIADRAALTSGGRCEAGDVLGMVDNDVVLVGSDLETVGIDVARRLVSSGGELLTVVVGQGAPAGLGPAVADAAGRERRGLETSVLDGGQPIYTLLLGVE